MTKANYAETAVVDWLLGGATPSRPGARYLALHTGDPGETGAANELSGSGYARQAASFGAASSGSASNTSTHTFTAAGGNWGTVTHFSIWDAASSGNCLYVGALTTPRTINDGESGTVAAGAVVCSED
ncbi:MAG: hypothetical protein ACK4YQ_08265 [Phenylobacterium sp.]|uniref:phage tail fiber protein n=1 Tax=Phenylobacterium sp. TaxID=1871053 RepID=UPI003918A376